MRNLLRNQRTVWYRLCEGREPVLDGDGNDTGETAVAYSDPVAVRANVSPATGSSSQELFGVGVEYDRVAQLPGTGWPIDERSVLYVDSEPPETPDRYAAGADYAVVRVAESLNQTSLAMCKVRDADA